MARNSDILGTGTSVYAEMNAPGHVCNRNESTATPPCMPPVHPTLAALSKMKAQPMVHRLNWTLAGTGNCHTVCPRACAPHTPAAHITLFIPVVLTLDESVGIGRLRSWLPPRRVRTHAGGTPTQRGVREPPLPPFPTPGIPHAIHVAPRAGTSRVEATVKRNPTRRPSGDRPPSGRVSSTVPIGLAPHNGTHWGSVRHVMAH